jgi:hypothetical protein
MACVLFLTIPIFAEKKGFNEEQTSGFFSIVKSVHEKAVGKYKFVS